MLREKEAEEEDNERISISGLARKRYLRSVSWTDRSPTKPSTCSSSNPRPQPNRPSRSFLPPLSISRRNAEEWPRAGSDDLGVWPNNPQTPRGNSSSNPSSNSSSEKREFEFKRDKLAFFDKECSRIAEHIYLGSDAVAKNREVLRRNGITHVLNCVGFVCPEYFKPELAYKTLWLKDTPSEDITSVLYDVFDYFEDVRERKGRVFVHCCQGVSRSNTLVIAYLMWREGQSFEDAFQYVKSARGVTNPNMGFACQLLQCQKRVHAVPASPDSTPRVYRIAPHSPYSPLHLVPKAVSDPGPRSLDSRGAFVVHVPSALYVWIGKNCSSVMSDNARAAAFQVVRYERAKGSVVDVVEGEEPPEFWKALSGGFGGDGIVGGDRRVEGYDLDFEVFQKALVGGVVPPFSVSVSGSETRLPARENGWSRLRRKFSIGMMREFIASSKLCSREEEEEEEEKAVSLCGSPDKMPSINSCGSLEYSFSNKFGPTKSPTLSPSTSDYASTFSFSPSSSNWSCDLSSRQPSPSSGLDSFDPFPIKNVSSLDSPTKLLGSEEAEEFYGEDRDEFPSKGVSVSRSIAERRGSNPPPRMWLPSVDESPQVPRNLGRSWSFSIGDIDDDDDDDEEMKDFDRSEYKDTSEKEVTMDEGKFRHGNELLPQSRTKGKKGQNRLFSCETVVKPVLYKWPSLNKIEGSRVCELDSRSSYVLVARESSLESRKVLSTLTFWLGSETLHEREKNDESCREMIGRDFLNQMDIPLDTPFQVVREGEEPEKFLNQLRCLALQATKETGHGT